MDVLSVLCEPLQQTHLQQSVPRMSPTTWDETSRGRNPENGRCCRQSGFQHTYGPWPSSLELFTENHNAIREGLNNLRRKYLHLGNDQIL